ncbi:MAG: bifunctional folylpolyglutamate synthase/dihydrofolate synthase [Clostridia bacterium]|nr:bifunctional folylpolyglutamate synthase/dihydrofolate synthase [Clostridia bacterium]
MTCKEAIAYIHSNHWQKKRPGLSRIRTLLEQMGDPQKQLRFLHVAGTNGKGSVCAMSDAILRAAGYRTGLFTSPYIRIFHERMQINGTPISDEELAEITAYVKGFADKMEDAPTEFELITAIAMEFFRRQGAEVVVLEVGLGGRMDSTNVIEQPLLSVITGIDFDHIAQLGNTLHSIAAEKAGIVKEGCPVLYGGTVAGSACRTISSVAEMRHAPFYQVDRSSLKVKEYSLERTLFSYGDYEDLELALLGTYQPFNAATVLNIVEILNTRGLSISPEAVREGLRQVRWPARFELFSTDPVVLFDGGHNPQGIAAAVQSIQAYFPEQKVNLLTGVMTDKAYDEMVERLRPVAEKVYTVTPENPRALSAEDYAVEFRTHKIPAQAYASLEEALRSAMEDCRAEGTPLICLGSLYLYGPVADLLKH